MNEKELLGEYKLVLGLEIHLHVKTANKMFCGDRADIYDAEPNTHTCPVCLGLPGALPVPNFEAVQKTQLLGAAFNCELHTNSKFDRKHYFYPDLPKGYQISQYKQPLCGEGYVPLLSGEKAELERIHLEEDTAKSFHEGNKTLIDFNKSGMPLIEIVTKPTFKNIRDAVEFSKKVQDVIRYLGIGEGDMEKGQMRLEANISLRTKEMEERGELPKYKVEIKNINSFRFMERAVKAEIVRQRELFERGIEPSQENRGFNEATGKTVLQRSKEEAHDYRYFPEPDIPPMVFEESYLEDIRKSLSELPWDREERLKNLGLSENAAAVLSSGVSLDLYEKFKSLTDLGIEPVKAGNALVNRKDLRILSAKEIAEELKKSEEKTSDVEFLKPVIDEVFNKNSEIIERYKNGKTNVIEFLIGQVMKETKGKAESSVVRAEILKALESK
jgi:aspartyl-tRNA(Asn)/glutamyl-tRNA(Gln) amidotransferase subunit B